jgi:hypothetical protein
MAPSAYSTIAGVRNVLLFKTHDSGTTWEVEYTTYGGVETTFVQPVLSANGTVGGASFAVSSTTAGSSGEAYRAFDNNTATYTFSVGSTYTIIIYNPNELKVSGLSFINRSDRLGITAYTFYGSNDGTNYTTIGSYTNAVTTAGASWSTAINSIGFYKYHKIFITATGATECNIAEIDLSAVYIAT